MTHPEPFQDKMRAWSIGAYGEPVRLRELPIPLPKAHDILIRMHGAEVGDWDEVVRLGEWPMERPFPLVLGLAGAGTVAALGSEVSHFAEGDPVYAYSYPLRDNGAWGEFMLVPESYAARPPASLPLSRAGALPIAALTAHETILDLLHVKEGEVVLISAAAGGVGHLAVQIAAGLGARVVALAGRRNRDFVSFLGAEAVIDYASEDVAEAVRARYPGGADKALNGVSGEAANRMVWALKEGGHMVDLPGTVVERRPDVRVDSNYAVRGDGDRLGSISAMIDEGRLRVEVQDLFPFDHAQEALDRVLAKHVRGKVGLEIPATPRVRIERRRATAIAGAPRGHRRQSDPVGLE